MRSRQRSSESFEVHARSEANDSSPTQPAAGQESASLHTRSAQSSAAMPGSCTGKRSPRCIHCTHGFCIGASEAKARIPRQRSCHSGGDDPVGKEPAYLRQSRRLAPLKLPVSNPNCLCNMDNACLEEVDLCQQGECNLGDRNFGMRSQARADGWSVW